MKTHVTEGDKSAADVLEIHSNFVVISLDTDERALVMSSDLFGETEDDKTSTRRGLKIGDEIHVDIVKVEPGSRGNIIRARMTHAVIRAQHPVRPPCPTSMMLRRRVA